MEKALDIGYARSPVVPHMRQLSLMPLIHSLVVYVLWALGSLEIQYSDPSGWLLFLLSATYRSLVPGHTLAMLELMMWMVLTWHIGCLLIMLVLW